MAGELPDSKQTVGAFDAPDHPFPLEVGAGERPTPGFIHNDARPLPDIEVVCDARDLPNVVGHDRCSVVRACHVLEHFPYDETVNVLSEWKSLLAPGGSVHIEVPNMGWQTTAHANGEITDEEFVYFAYGEQNYSGNFHCAGFTSALLHLRLQQTGFVDINVVDIGQVLVANATKLK
jgi:predicted SAM-dependent methyltransferase